MSKRKKGIGVGKYRLHISWLGVLAVALALVPNIIWKVKPALNNPLSIAILKHPNIDTIKSICEIAMIVLLIIIVNIHWNKRPKRQGYLVLAIVCLALYYGSWILYYKGLYQNYDIIAMAVLPSLYFVFVDLKLKNHIALISTVAFAVFHITGVVLEYLI